MSRQRRATVPQLRVVQVVKAVDGRGGRGYLRPALEVIHSSPWHNLDKEKSINKCTVTCKVQKHVI